MRGKRTDHNQTAVVKELRALGVFIQDLSQVGKGCPDLLCGFRGRWYVIELKNPKQVPSKRKQTEDEVRWKERLYGRAPYVLAETTEEIMKVLLAPGS